MPELSKDERKQKVLAALNKARAMELLAIGQYMNQHYKLDDMDYGELAGKIKLIAIDEMRHAEMFAERIKELAANPPPIPTARWKKARTSSSSTVSTPSWKTTPLTSTTSLYRPAATAGTA